jgi:hypothetical protein
MWRVYPHYEIEEGIIKHPHYKSLVEYFTEATTPWLVTGLKDYRPSDCPKLPEMFARIRDGNEADVKKFVHEYGELGHDRLAMKQGHKEWCVGGDPVDWFFAHVKTVRLCLELTKLLQDDNAGRRIKECLKTQGTNGQLTYAILSQWVSNRWPIDVPGYKDPIELARATRRSLINGNTRYIYHYFHGVRVRTKRKLRGAWVEDEDGHGDEARVCGFTALIEVIYQHIANAVMNGNQVRQCKNDRCGRYFVPSTKRQEYCRTSCGKSARERDRRRRQRQKQT